jgi:micrococcal nuclease
MKQFLKGLAILTLSWGTFFSFAFTYGIKQLPAIENKVVNEENLYWYKAEITSVYDGDTYTCMVSLGMNVYKEEKLRAWGIDTPELRGEEKVFGKRVRDTVRNRILNTTVYIKTFKDKKGKYGRYLGEVFYVRGDSLINLNKQLVDEQYASEYMMAGEEFSKPLIFK